MRFILSLFLGLIPDVLYFTLFFIFTKNLKEKRIKLFLLVTISYIICVFVQRWKILFYLISMTLFYLSLKILYKEKVQIIDVFVISLACFYITFLSFILIPFVKADYSNYVFIYIINEFLVFFPFVFKNIFNKTYKKYCKFWNRNDAEKRPIKSITLRNVSLVLLNGIIFFMNVTISNIIDFIK